MVEAVVQEVAGVECMAVEEVVLAQVKIKRELT